MDVGTVPDLAILAPARRECLPEPSGNSVRLTPVEYTAAAVDTDSVGDGWLVLRLHLVEVLVVAVLDTLEIVEDGLALANTGVSIDGKVDWRPGGLAHGLRLGEAESPIVLTLRPREVGYVGGITVFVTAHDLEPRLR